ncbi:MAG TPA: tetratricopeptide repeat protein [Pyrinomonadaceae bacterium]|nr:tetratricopeptide repeat protein [Pyrinomonadaceae bacterium]
MSTFSRFRLFTGLLALVGLVSMGAVVSAQDVGVDVGGGAGIFRPKNPETKRRTVRTTVPAPKRTTTSRGTPAPATPEVDAERVEELLEKGNGFRDARRFAEAEDAYQSVLKMKPQDSRASYGLGNVYADQQRWEESENAYRVAVLGSSDVDALIALSVVLTQPRTGAGNAKRLADAEAFARRAIQIDPKSAVAWDRLGVALQSRGLVNNDTETAYRRAVELDPQFAIAYAHLARVLNKLGRSSEAGPLYLKAAELAKDPATLNLIAESLQSEQQWENSGPILKRALELDPRNPNALYLMGRMLVVFKRYQEAEPYLKQATEVSPKAFQPLNLLGRSYLAMGRNEEAEITYERAAGIAPPGDRKQLGGAFGFEGVGDAFMKANNKTSAARAYKRALELDPGNKQLEQKLASAR